jgi:Tol biopolymer transport system component
MDLNGGNARALTNGKADSNPSVSPDGKWVVYEADFSGTLALWKMPVDGGEPVRLADQPGEFPAISPDGKFVACSFPPDENQFEENPAGRIALIRIAGGPTKLLKIPTTARFPVHWTSDGHALAYVDTREGISNIWIQPIAGGPPKQFTDFKSNSIIWFGWSRDGKVLTLARGSTTSDVVFMSNFR